jgi:hypothetical protein
LLQFEANIRKLAASSLQTAKGGTRSTNSTRTTNGGTRTSADSVHTSKGGLEPQTVVLGHLQT